MQQGATLFGARLVKEGHDGFGARGLALQRGKPLGIKFPNGIAHGLVATTESMGNIGCALGACGGEQDLATADGKGVHGA